MAKQDESVACHLLGCLQLGPEFLVCEAAGPEFLAARQEAVQVWLDGERVSLALAWWDEAMVWPARASSASPAAQQRTISG